MSEVRTGTMLAQRQSLPLDAKVVLTQRRIIEWHDHWQGDICVSVSGGKDSLVLLHQVRKLYPKTVAVFVDTGLEYPEVRECALAIPNLIVLKPKLAFPQVIAKYGYPVVSKEQAQFVFQTRTGKSEKLKQIRLHGNKWGRGKISEKWKFLLDAPFPISHKCCHYLKKQPFEVFDKQTGLKAMIGTTAAESSKRATDWVRFGCNAFDTKRPLGRPLSVWTDDDIWQYIRANNIDYPAVYDMGYKRTGCMFCMFGVHLEREPNRFQLMQKTHPKQYEYCIHKLGLGKVLDYIGVHYSAEQ